jgi:glycosyltransferase involved in cell wall biosynthesis
MARQTIAAVIPVHNKGRLVARAIASVFSQTRPVDEIIVVDDASTDDSLEQLQPFLASGIRLLRRDRPGPGGYAARNLAIREAKSDWIAFLDADDAWKPDFIEEISRMIAQAPASTGCAFTGYETVWPDRAKRDGYSASFDGRGYRRLDFNAFVSAWIKHGSCPIWTSACAMRRDLLLKAGLFPEHRCRRGGDKDLWLRALAEADAISSARPSATYYKETGNQVTRMEATNIRHCLSATLEQMMSEAVGRRRTLLRRLFNSEAFEYARRIGQRERVSPEIYRGFFVSLDPSRYVILLALTYMPVPLQQLFRNCLLWGSSMARKIVRQSAA